MKTLNKNLENIIQDNSFLPLITWVSNDRQSKSDLYDFFLNYKNKMYDNHQTALFLALIRNEKMVYVHLLDEGNTIVDSEMITNFAKHFEADSLFFFRFEDYVKTQNLSKDRIMMFQFLEQKPAKIRNIDYYYSDDVSIYDMTSLFKTVIDHCKEDPFDSFQPLILTA
jgi:hypothetical protein